MLEQVARGAIAVDPCVGHAGVWLLQLSAPELTEDIFADVGVRKVITALIALVIAFSLLAAINRVTDWGSERVPRRFRLLIKQSLPFWRGLILVLTIAYIANLFLRLSPNNVLALTGTLAVALGFAFKDYVSSITAGIVALFESPYRVGDRVRIGDHYGEVVDYGLRSIQIRTPQDSLVRIPHSKLWTESISSANSGALEAQVVTDFYFAHDVDFALVRKILLQTAYTSKYTQLKLPVLIVASEQPWGTHFKLKCYPMDARDEFVYQTDLIERAKCSFARYQLAYPALPQWYAERDKRSS